ncbi:hypothetical protein TRIP_B200684 [uncultured Desulfatiglans sp.]|uniref:Uncharacterized protein n=1 Tax=Uncultured Desulfatiglans sp. TaxID=1748965 RepID=A0A653A3F9_UNCDX|nr:hypothetical protein TRIP_B200684 [uncultured Desulfatiglans sp.]
MKSCYLLDNLYKFVFIKHIRYFYVFFLEKRIWICLGQTLQTHAAGKKTFFTRKGGAKRARDVDTEGGLDIRSRRNQ